MYKKIEALVRDSTYSPEWLQIEEKYLQMFTDTPPNYGLDSRKMLFPRLKGIYLAHGSYGAALAPAQDAAHAFSLLIEQDPSHFYYNLLYKFIVRSLRHLAEFLRVPPTQLVFVSNVETGIQSVLNSIPVNNSTWFYLSFTYGAVRMSLEHYAAKRNVHLCCIDILDISNPLQIIAEIESALLHAKLGDLLVIEHITSPTAVILPLQQILDACRRFNVRTLVDAAHTVGQLNVDFDALQPDYYISNCHKWLCTTRYFVFTRGCAYLYKSAQSPPIKPLVISWGNGNGFLSDFIWQGTNDYSAILSVSMSIATFKWMGASNVIERNHQMAIKCGRYLCNLWKTEMLVPETMVGAMVTIRVPSFQGRSKIAYTGDLHEELYKRQIQVPVFAFNGKKYIRVSIHVYNHEEEWIKLGQAVLEILSE
jgi:isopenicillin-N epimerase